MTVARISLLSLLTAVLFYLPGCANLYQDRDPPKVSVQSFRMLPEEGVPRFEIKMRIINPNTEPLDIAGVAYTIEVMGRELLAGVTNEVPLVEGYSEEVLTLEAGLQLFELVRFVAGLGTATGEMLDYRFTAKIDFNGMVPTQRVEDTGEIRLN